MVWELSSSSVSFSFLIFFWVKRIIYSRRKGKRRRKRSGIDGILILGFRYRIDIYIHKFFLGFFLQTPFRAPSAFPPQPSYQNQYLPYPIPQDPRSFHTFKPYPSKNPIYLSSPPLSLLLPTQSPNFPEIRPPRPAS